MPTIIKNVKLLPEAGISGNADVIIEDAFIREIRRTGETSGADAYNAADAHIIDGTQIVDGGGNLLVPGFYNAHCHSPMSLLRGIGEDLPLQRWLEEKIYPAEDKLDEDMVYWGSMLAAAEMIKNGVVSFSDMYWFCGATARAVDESGMKANISRAVISFDDGDPAENTRFRESAALADEYHGASDGRIRIDMALHAEYTNKPRTCAYIAEYAASRGLGLHVHISETEREHAECIARHGMTPTRFFESLGALDIPVTAAHCVFVSPEDIEILTRHNVCVVHNPTSNLKLGSGVMPLRAMLDAGVRVALGTDGAASNNVLDILGEFRLAAILHKGIFRRADITTARGLTPLLSRSGALAQGREDCGIIAPGCRADLVLLDLSAVNNIPSYDLYSTLAYSANSGNVLLTMADGRILYERGEYKYIDAERVRYEAARIAGEYFTPGR